MLNRTQRKKKKDWSQIKSTPMESNEIVCNHLEPVETDIDIVIDIVIEIEIDLEIDY